MAVAVLVTALVAGAVVFVNQQRPPSECPPAGPDLRGVLDERSATVEAICSEPPEVFRERLRAELASDIGEHLWRHGVEAADTDAAVALWLEEHTITLPGGPPWRVPDEPDWTESPYANISWEAGYQSLAWLATLARGYRAGHPEFADDLRHYLMSWIEANPLGRGKSIRSWSNGTVHRRANALVAMWDVLLQVLTDEELERVLRSLHDHGARLHSYLSAERFRGHNHNLFHAMALVNLGRNVTLLADAAQWREDALQRMHTLLREMVNPEDGVSTEQAAAYHYVAMRLFLNAQRSLRLENDGLAPDGLELLTEMTRFGALLPDSAGNLPAIGDTPYGTSADSAMSLLAQFAELGLTGPEADYILTGGARGEHPPDAAFFAGEGYAIFRQMSEGADAPGTDLHVVVDMGPEPRVHGHDDAMNILLSVHGVQLLVDSGGPYQYGVEEREAFTSAEAHNVVVLEGAAGDGAGAQIERTADAADYSLISGEKPLSSDVTHQRTVILVKPSLLLVVDRLVGGRDQGDSYQLLYHLPPGADVSSRGSTAFATVDGAGLGVAVAASAPLEAEIIDGWVTRSLASREMAPVLRFVQPAGTAWFVTALVPGASAETLEPSIEAERTADGFRVEVVSGGAHWSLVVPDDSAPLIAANGAAGAAR